MIKFIKKIFIGPGMDNHGNKDSPIKENFRILKEIWNDKESESYGIERVFKLFLNLIQLVFPTIYIRLLFKGLRTGSIRFIIDVYLILKLVLPILVLYLSWYKSVTVIIINVYLMLETGFTILGLIFLSESKSSKISYKRSILILIINYLQVTLGFSLIYAGYDLLNKRLTPFEAVYYSFVTMTTLGYGDYFPVSDAGKLMVILQLIVFILFVVLFINYFSHKLNIRKKELD
ncbi:hypothetical protein KAU33_14290 [Candidatus Dependentiae bacterium]|nr:hypothetical protein [Candidatus Dependentiae bacterium]